MPLQALHVLSFSGKKFCGHSTSPLLFRLKPPPFFKCNVDTGNLLSDIFRASSMECTTISSPKSRLGRTLVKCQSFRSKKHQPEVPEWEEVAELPILPLPLVLFPGAVIPLQIFEFRYRIMVHTLLQSDLRFGIIYSDNGMNGAADVGCVAEVVKHERLTDDRFFLICKGQERFRIMDLVRTKPYLVAEVEWLEDRPSSGLSGEAGLEALALEVERYMRDVVRISNRLSGKPEKDVKDLRGDLFPTPFSFLVGSTFEGAPREQQVLLELEDTAMRLQRERETLRNTLSYLAAASAVNDVFQPKLD